MRDIINYLLAEKSFDEKAGKYPFLGMGTKLIDKKSLSYKLSDTSYADWNASTTPGVILAAPENNDFTFSDLNAIKNGYRVVVKAVTNVVPIDNVETVNLPVKNCYLIVTDVYCTPKDYEGYQSGTLYNPKQSTYIECFEYAYNSSGVLTAISTTGDYSPLAMISDTITVARTSIGFKRGDLRARCQSTYFKTANKTNIDADKTKIDIGIELYETPVENFEKNVFLAQMRGLMNS